MKEEFDRESINPNRHVATVFPLEWADALVKAGRAGDLAQIDALTDRLVVLGYCRNRSSQSLRNGGVA